MKLFLTTFIFISIIFIAAAQPCKQVRIGMTKAEVLKLVGTPTEIDSLGHIAYVNGKKKTIFVWQYGDVTKPGNQRVQFSGNKVVAEVIADGLKYDELMAAYQLGDFPSSELSERIKKLNLEACK